MRNYWIYIPPTVNNIKLIKLFQDNNPTVSVKLWGTKKKYIAGCPSPINKLFFRLLLFDNFIIIELSTLQILLFEENSERIKPGDYKDEKIKLWEKKEKNVTWKDTRDLNIRRGYHILRYRISFKFNWGSPSEKELDQPFRIIRKNFYTRLYESWNFKEGELIPNE